MSTPHAGELAGPESVRVALDALGAQRLQHGVRCIEDPALAGLDQGVDADLCRHREWRTGVGRGCRDSVPVRRRTRGGCLSSIAAPSLAGRTRRPRR